MNAIHAMFPRPSLQAVAEAIREAEASSGGEVRVELREKRARSEANLSVEAMARKAFVDLGMTGTRDRTGVLIFVLLGEREFCVLADEGIHARVDPSVWTGIATAMTQAFRKGVYGDAVRDAVRAVGQVLRQHVPRRPDDRNELPDRVVVR